MMAFVLLKLASAVVSVSLAAGMLARDHELKANRLLAAFLLCNAYWAVCEFFLYQATDREVAAGLYRAMTLGWVPLGLLCAHASVTLSAMDRHPVTRLLPICYVAMAFLLPISFFTDWVIRDAEQISMGWRATFGPGMLVAYSLMATPLLGVLGSWRSMLQLADSGGQLLLAQVVFFGVTGALVCGTATAVILPLLEIETVGLTTTLIAGVGLGVAWTLRRFGHSLISAEAFAREILDTLEDGVVLVDEDGRLRDANRAFLRMIGERESIAIGRPVTEWLPGLSDAPQLSAERSTAPTLVELVTRVGEKVPLVASAPVACMNGRRSVGHAYLLRDRREIVSLQRQLTVSARLAAVGDLSKAISASINEPVAQIRDEFEGLSVDWETIGDLLEWVELEDDCREAAEEGKELIEECVEGVDRIFSIVREVAGFSGEGEQEPFAPHPLDQIVRRAVRVARVQAPPGLEIDARLDPDVKILCHFAEIERVVTNLLVNAIHALEGRSPGQAHLVVAVAAQDGRALLHVEDDGCGIEASAIERIFDPFFTTKPVGKGTGLGLAISYHTVKAHGGEIRVSSIPDQGTSVAVELPRAPLEAN